MTTCLIAFIAGLIAGGATALIAISVTVIASIDEDRDQ